IKTSTGPHVRPPTGPHTRPPPSGAYSQGGLDVELDSVALQLGASRKRGRTVAAAIFLGSVLLGLGVVWALTRAETPLPKGKVPATTESPPSTGTPPKTTP